ncbi:hypothetical protein Hanom_Chr03g00202401 [Helianthus anomalus]
MFMLNKVLENLIGKSVEQKFEEIQVEEVRARRQAAIDAEMKNKDKSVEGEDDENKKDDADDVFSASSHDDDDKDDDQGTSGIKVSEKSNEENVDDYLRDDVNEEPEDAEVRN